MGVIGKGRRKDHILYYHPLLMAVNIQKEEQ
jgi:hypothetical protein